MASQAWSSLIAVDLLIKEQPIYLFYLFLSWLNPLKLYVANEEVRASENEKSDGVVSGVTSSAELKIQLEELKHLEHFYFTLTLHLLNDSVTCKPNKGKVI